MQLQFKRVLDLTQPLDDKTAVYPGDPLIRIKEVAHLDKEGFTVASIHLNDHAGTHIETQCHMMPGRQLIG